MIFERIDVGSVPKNNRHFSKSAIGMELKYNLGEHSGIMKILDIVDGKSYPTISFLIGEEVYNISQNNINNYMHKLLYGNKFGFSTGDIVNGLEILCSNKSKYTVKCLIDGYEFEISESDLKKGKGCPVCNCRILVPGINDFASTKPEYVKYLKNPADAYENFYGSAKKTTVKCQECGFEKEVTYNYLTEKGFGCPMCSDGISFGEKYVAALLFQVVGNRFEAQKVFNWAKNKKYDFYLPDQNYIIEVHGLQHYEEPVGNWKSKSLKEQQENDMLKECLAKDNGIDKYIVIDARISDAKYIKKSILNSFLSVQFDMSEINWTQCLKNTMTSYVIRTADLWNSGMSVKNISKEINLSTSTVRKYLKQANTLEMVNYNPKQGEYLHRAG